MENLEKVRKKVNGKTKYNFLNTETNNYISEQWYDWCGNFYEGFADVELNSYHNYIDTNGKLLSDEWFEYCCGFCDDGARVKLKGKWYIIDNEGKLNPDLWT